MTRKTWRATRSYTTNGKVCGWLTREYCLDPKHFCDHSLTCARTTWFTQHVVHAWWHWNHSWNINQATHSAFWMVWSRCTTTLYDNMYVNVVHMIKTRRVHRLSVYIHASIPVIRLFYLAGDSIHSIITSGGDAYQNFQTRIMWVRNRTLLDGNEQQRQPHYVRLSHSAV